MSSVPPGAGHRPAADPQTGTVVSVRDAFCLHPIPDGAVVALRGLSLDVAAGELVVVHGPNGSGKTTLLRLLAGEQPLAAGTAIVGGRSVGSRRDGEDLPADIGRVDQDPARNLRPEFDVLGNIIVQQRLRGIERRTAIEAARPLARRLRVEELFGRDVRTLSGGEAQRVAICAALAHAPALLLADEPTGQLDLEAAEEVYDALAESVAHTGSALVLVSHDVRAARIAQRVIRIRDGRLSETWAGPAARGTGARRPVAPGSAAAGSVAPGPELLVVDDRGWLRLPGTARPTPGQVHTVRPEIAADGAITLHPQSITGEPLAAAQSPDELTPPRPEELPGPVDVPARAAPMARLGAVHKSYPAGARPLRGLDLTVAAGVLTVVRGPSGSGKSTLLRLVLGLERPDSGVAELDGHDLRGLDRAALAGLRRGLLSYVGQQPQLAETLDGAANLDLARTVRGLPVDEETALAVLRALGLTAFSGRPVQLLSGGERQRTALARALVVRPRLLVCDEPTSALDEARAGEISSLLGGYARSGAAVLVASHDPVLCEKADLLVDLGAPEVRAGRTGQGS